VVAKVVQQILRKERFYMPKLKKERLNERYVATELIQTLHVKTRLLCH
jgi:hypothetical protein